MINVCVATFHFLLRYFENYTVFAHGRVFDKTCDRRHRFQSIDREYFRRPRRSSGQGQ